MQYTHQCNFTIGITTNKPHLFYTQLNSSMQNEFCCELSLVSFPLSPGGELVVILDVQNSDEVFVTQRDLQLWNSDIKGMDLISNMIMDYGIIRNG